MALDEAGAIIEEAKADARQPHGSKCRLKKFLQKQGKRRQGKEGTAHAQGKRIQEDMRMERERKAARQMRRAAGLPRSSLRTPQRH